MKSENRPNGLTCTQDREKTGQSEKSHKGYISPIWGEAPAEPNSTKICMVYDVHDVIMSAKFHI